MSGILFLFIITNVIPFGAERKTTARPFIVIDTFSACITPKNGLPCNWHASRDATGMFSVIQDTGNFYLRVRSSNDATSIARRQRYSSEEYPFLQWQWRVRKLPHDAREDVKKQGDSAAGVYVIFDGTLYFNTVLKYVWSSSLPPGTTTKSPYNSRTQIIVLRSGSEGLDVWLTERVNLNADYRTLFGRSPPLVEAIGLMSDSDNTGSESWADYDNFIMESAP